MKSKKALSILLVAALTTAAAGCSGGGGGGDASSATAVEMRVQRQAGTVTLSNDKGENVTLMEKMRLNAGHNLDTAKESFVMVSFDETKVMTLEENGSASVVQKGNTLQFDVKKGRALVNLTEQLKDGQSAEVRSGNMVCGMTGTAVEGEFRDGKPTVKVLESDTKKVTITVLDGQGNPTSQTEAKPGEMAVLQSDGATVDISNCNLEDFSAASLYAIGQNPDLAKKAAETYGVPEDHVNALAKLVTTEGENAGPLSGAAAEVMEKALKDTKGATGDALNAEQSILANTRQLLDKVMAGQMSEEDKKSLLNTANEQMNTVVKAALDAGVQGEELNNIAKNVAESITNVASTAIDQGKSVTEITDQTKTTGTNLGTAVTRNGNNGAAMAQAIEQIRNTTAPQQPTPQPTPQPAQNPAPAQPQTPQAENPPQETPPVVDDDDDDDYDSGGGSYTPPTPPTPPTPSSSATPPEPVETTTVGTVLNKDGERYNVRLSNGSEGYVEIESGYQGMLTVTTTSTTPIVLPVSVTQNGSPLTSYDGSPVIIRSLAKVIINAPNLTFKVNSDSLLNIVSVIGLTSNTTVYTANTKYHRGSDEDAQITAEATTRSREALSEFKNCIGSSGIGSATYGSVIYRMVGNNPQLELEGLTLNNLGYSMETNSLKVWQANGASEENVRYIHPDGSVTTTP